MTSPAQPAPYAEKRGHPHASLMDLAVGQSGFIRGIRARGELGRRLRDMGLMPGVRLTVRGRAPLGDPVSVALDGYDLSLRCQEARQVLVEPAR